jgi:phosphoesterase RecJ-like protein
MKNRVSVEEVAKRLLPLRTVAVVSHVDPDPDAYGSLLGLGLTLEEQGGKTVHFVNQSGIVAQYQGFPGIERVSSMMPELDSLDAVVVLDCGDLSRVGDSFKGILIPDNVEVMNIDHHYSNSAFGTCALVSAEASSTSEIVVEILRAMNLSPGPLAAQALYCGISGDTGSFQYSCTTEKTFRIAAELIAAGADPSQASQLLYGSVRSEAVKLQAFALTEMQFHYSNRVTEVLLSASDFERFSADPFDAESLVERARDIQGVDVSFFIREHDDLWKVSLRSKSDAFDVSKVAESFGGGGHKAAAAFRWRGELGELRSSLLEKLAVVIGA